METLCVVKRVQDIIPAGPLLNWRNGIQELEIRQDAIIVPLTTVSFETCHSGNGSDENISVSQSLP